VFISDVILVWFGVFLGLMIKNFYTKTLTDYTEDLMKLKNYKSYSFVFVSVLLITSVLGTSGCMAIVTYFKLVNIWFKFILGVLIGFMGVSTIRAFVNVEVKGDTATDVIKKVIKSKFGGINITIGGNSDSDDDEVDDKPKPKPRRSRTKS
jgi:cytochrome c biogenesis protein CcdA